MERVHFDWSDEIHKVISKSLVTTFALDFLLFEDKKGGDVDTIHNVRQGVWATEQEKQNYENHPKYDSDAYHQHQNYKAVGKSHKDLRQEGELKDAYRNGETIDKSSHNLDHVISAHEVHHDAGRILAGLDGVDLANQTSNLSATGETINKVKKQHSTEHFLNTVLPNSIRSRENELYELHQKIYQMPQETPQQKHEYQKISDEIRKKQERLEELKQVDAEAMKKVDADAREKYNEKIDTAYYTSSKFFSQTAGAAVKNGFKMGARQVIGLIFAEIWFELREQIPLLMKKYKQMEFKIKEFFNDLKNALVNIFERVKIRFKTMIESFKEGMLSGIFSSVMTTVLNIFLTTTKLWGRIIRETWLQIVQFVKLVFFNPDNLSTSDLVKASFKLVSAGVGTVVGVLINNSLTTLHTMPFGSEIAVFLSALSSGLVILGLNYFIDTSSTMQKLWDYLDRARDKYENTLLHFQKINQELDRYLLELTQLEFGINANELHHFALGLNNINDELERNIYLKAHLEAKNIKLPFEMGNVESTKDWLLGLCDK